MADSLPDSFMLNQWYPVSALLDVQDRPRSTVLMGETLRYHREGGAVG